MKKIKYLGLLITCCLYIVCSCSKMNDKHDFYLQDGEIIYIGRVDSAQFLPGKERFVLRYWVSDSRAKELKVFWNEKNDSLEFAIPEHMPNDSIDILIGDDKKEILEGDYVFELITTDGKNITSISFELPGTVYGDKYEATLTRRLIKETIYDIDNNQLTISWIPPSSSNDAGLEITYFEGEQQKVIVFDNEDLECKTILDNVNIEMEISYRSMFIPQITAIDTFFTSPTKIPIIQNVALGKPVITSSNLNDNFNGSKAVDGIISTSSRWISKGDAGLEHWIEIDLEREFNLHSFKLHKHLYNQFLIPNFIFQSNVNGEWINILEVENNFSEMYEGVFHEPVTTDKVRLFIPNYENNQVRIMEIAVFAEF